MRRAGGRLLLRGRATSEPGRHLGLGIVQLGAWAAFQYTWPLVAVAMAREPGWDRATLSVAFSAGMLMTGLLAPYAGAAIDRIGGRVVLVGAGLLGTAGLVGWSWSATPAGHLVAQLVIGAAAAGTLYDAAFAALARHADSRERWAVGVWRISLLGALAGPAAALAVGWLLAVVSWRDALQWMAVATLLLVVVPSAVCLGGAAREPSRAPGRPPPALRPGNAMSAMFALAALAVTALQTHLPFLIVDRGGSPAEAAAALAVLNGVKLPARLLVGPVAHRLGAAGAVQIFLVGLGCAVGVVALVPGGTGWWMGLVACGCADALASPMRAAAVRERASEGGYGRELGRTALWVAVGRAGGPVLPVALAGSLGGLDGGLLALGLPLLVSGALARRLVRAA